MVGGFPRNRVQRDCRGIWNRKCLLFRVQVLGFRDITFNNVHGNCTGR